MNTNSAHILQKENAAKAIFSITPFTLLDYPHKSACILWFAGCNMRCLYCYNPEIVLGKGKISFETALSFLQKRKGLLDAVVLSGGECTLHKNLIPFIKQIRAMGFAIKIDTNGSNPKVLHELITENLIDYVALDFKALPEKFQRMTQSNLFNVFEASFQLLLNSIIQFEIRTTLHSDLIDATELALMLDYLEEKQYQGTFYIQHFVNNVATLGNLPLSVRTNVNKDWNREKIKVEFRGT